MTKTAYIFQVDNILYLIIAWNTVDAEILFKAFCIVNEVKDYYRVFTMAEFEECYGNTRKNEYKHIHLSIEIF